MAEQTDYSKAEKVLLKSILEGNGSVANRGTLGTTVPIQLFQALRLIGMGSTIEHMVGDGARAMVYQSGSRVGQVIGSAVAPQTKDVDTYLGLVAGLCKKLSIGVVIPEEKNLSEGKLTLRVDECVSCAGISGVAAPICNFEAGLVGGIVKAFAKKDVRAVETKCNAIGDNTCAISVQILGI